MEKVERLIIGNTLAANCFEGKVLDVTGDLPYPLRKVKIDGDILTALPMLVEECPESATCVELNEVVVLKEGNILSKACNGLACQKPWPLRWLEQKDKMLVTSLDLKMRNAMFHAMIKTIDLDNRRVTLRGGRAIDYEELVWTAPFPELSKLLGIKGPKSVEATIIVAKAKTNFDLGFHFGKNNPAIAIISYKRREIVWILAPGTHDASSVLKHLSKRGHVEGVKAFASYSIRYYALEDVPIREVKGVILKGRTAEWREMSLNEVMKCA